ncbi:MAG: STN domain-containing protein, partial [Opitutaceae bacterium]
MLLTALFVINLLCSVVLGAEPIKRQFDLPADGINQSMKRFAAQSGLEVLYPTDSVTGIRTKPVQGEMPAREALAVMLAGTGLEVVQDPRNGALTVRKSDPNGDRAAQTSDRSKSEEKIEDVPVRLGRFEVMESKILNMDIKRSRDDAQPYAIFDRKTIEQSGATMLDDFLKNQLPMNAIGRSNN